MQIKLNDLAEIILGHTFRGAVIESPDGDCCVIQAKNIKAEGNLSPDLVRTNVKSSRAKGFIRNGDILLSNRGNFRAAVYRGNKKNILAVSSVYILRIEKGQILPEYVAIYFNSKTGQNTLQNLDRGTLIKSLPKGDLLNLLIPTLTLEKQKKIIAIWENYLARKKLYAKKSGIHKNVTDYAINHLLTS